jgi:hypothetical protein
MIRIVAAFLFAFAFAPTFAANTDLACAPGDTITCIGPTTPPTPTDGCPAGAIRMKMDVTKPGTLLTRDFGGMGPDTILSVEIKTSNFSSADNNLPNISAAEYDGPPLTREAQTSTKPCDFPNPWMAPGAGSSGSTVTIPFALGTGANWDYYPTFQLNSTYYFNVRNWSGSKAQCVGACNLIVSLVVPGQGAQSASLMAGQKKANADVAKHIKEWKAKHQPKSKKK